MTAWQTCSFETLDCLLSTLLAHQSDYTLWIMKCARDKQTFQFILKNKYKLWEQPTNKRGTYNEMQLSNSVESIFATMYSTR